MFQQVENSPQRFRNGPRTHQGMLAGMATPHSTPAGHLWVSKLLGQELETGSLWAHRDVQTLERGDIVICPQPIIS